MGDTIQLSDDEVRFWQEVYVAHVAAGGGNNLPAPLADQAVMRLRERRGETGAPKRSPVTK